MKVKICGITNFNDATLALELGADAIGFILAPSPRQISVTQLQAITCQLPDKAFTVGVFVNEKPENILKIVQLTGLKAVQLHGQEKKEDLVFLKAQMPNLILLKAIAIQKNSFTINPDQYSFADILLFDSAGSHFSPELRKPIDSDILALSPYTKNFFLAGGLNIDNIEDMITRYNPSGVDISSGIEISPGKKDAQLMKKIILISKNKERK
ncbi:MAG: phosphoribosylanthranilate isomerase [Bacteriovoracaceae bacterium]